jgi:hypothetical protein
LVARRAIVTGFQPASSGPSACMSISATVVCDSRPGAEPRAALPAEPVAPDGALPPREVPVADEPDALLPHGAQVEPLAPDDTAGLHESRASSAHVGRPRRNAAPPAVRLAPVAVRTQLDRVPLPQAPALPHSGAVQPGLGTKLEADGWLPVRPAADGLRR